MYKFFKKRMGKKGFTLIELIVVIAILGILAAIAIPRFAGFQANANLKAAKSTMKTIETAIQSIASEKNTNAAGVATSDAYLNAVEALLGWTISDIAGGRVVTVDPVTPTGATYAITATGESQVTVGASAPWPLKNVDGTPKLTATWTDIKDK